MELMAPVNIFLDIETIPAGEKDPVEYPPYPTLDDVKVGNRKSDTAEAYREAQFPKLVEQYNIKCQEIDEKAEEKYRKRALNSTEASILCIGYAFDDEKPEVLTGDEKHIMRSFEGLLEQFGDKRHSIMFVGHNVKEFDLKLIYHRAIKYKLNKLAYQLMFMGKSMVYDTMEHWGFLSYREMTSQDNLLKYLGLGEKGDIDGSMVYDLYEAGEMFRIYDYCKKDVEDVRRIFKAMQP